MELVIVALIGNGLHIRVFDSNGEVVVDKSDAELENGPEKQELRNRVCNLAGLEVPQPEQLEILKAATWVTGGRILTVQIRSGGVTPGEEASSVLLSHHTQFDDDWHRVVIPLREFAGPEPFGELGFVKTLFTLALVGRAEVEYSVFIDGLHWDSVLSDPPLSADCDDVLLIGREGNRGYWLEWDSARDLSYEVQFSPNLVLQPTWMKINAAAIPGTGQRIRIVDTNNTNIAGGFYRLKCIANTNE